MGEKQARTLGQQKKVELKWQGTREGKQKRGKKRAKAHPGASGTAIRGHINGWPQNRKVGWYVGGGAGSLLPFFRLYLPSSTQKRHFLYLFISFSRKVVAALQEGVVLVGKKTQLGSTDLGR